jgi:hypothetical protein
VELEDAFRDLLGRDGDPDDLDDLAAAGRAMWAFRFLNTQRGALILARMRARGLSWREISALTGIPHATAARWSTPPGEGEK